MTRKQTLREIHASAVNQAVNRQVNVVLDDRPPLINNSEKDQTRKERTTLAPLRSGHCRLLSSCKSRINKVANLNVCADSGRTKHDVKHFYNCPSHPTTVTHKVLGRSIANYAAPVWSTNACGSNIGKIERIQNEALRIITGSPGWMDLRTTQI